MNRSIRFRASILLLAVSVALPASLGAAKPEATNKYFRTGKTYHAKAKKLKSSQRNTYCKNNCKRTSGKRKDDIGACMEGCVFG